MGNTVEAEYRVSNLIVYNHKNAESILKEMGLMDSLIKVLKSSDKYHESILHTLSRNKWETNKKLFQHADYRVSAYLDRIALEVEAVGKSGRIDILHRDLFRLMVLHSKKVIDAAVLVLRDKKSDNLNYHKAVSELKAYGKAVSVPVILIGI